MDQSVLVWLCISPQILAVILMALECYMLRRPWYFFFFAYQVTYTNFDTLIQLNFLQISLAAIVFTIPLLLLVKDGTGPMHVLFLGFCMWRLLVRIFDIARSLEERITMGERIKSASEVDITRIESGL